MDLSVHVFADKFKIVQAKINSKLELNEEELQVLLIAHLMEEERNEFSPKKP